jgi:DNA (cytosine-5)-methyltransferase 1
MDKNHFTFIDLFSGIGGFHLALQSLGGECLGFSEIHRDAISCYCENTGEAADFNFGDITKVKSLPSHDLLTAGVPCQSWSIAGRNLGFRDDRGQLWNDTIYLLNQSRPKAFIFENVKGLVDPRNRDALDYIMARIRDAGYHADFHVINSYDYGVMQNRVRIYIIGFLDRKCFENFLLPPPTETKMRLGDLLCIKVLNKKANIEQTDLFGDGVSNRQMSLSASQGLNDYFLYNDIRNGDTTIHSWDLLTTSEKQKTICLLLLRNRRKKAYGCLDGNPLSLEHLQALDKSITQDDIAGLIDLGILTAEDYGFRLTATQCKLTEEEMEILSHAVKGKIIVDELKANEHLKIKKFDVAEVLKQLLKKDAISCFEIRYDFKNTKISTGLNGVNRVFLPGSSVFPTLVASDTNDMVATQDIRADNPKEYRQCFLDEIHHKEKFRKITKGEACLLQGFPENYLLPESRSRWMRLIGNSVSVPVIKMLCQAIIDTGAFGLISMRDAHSQAPADIITLMPPSKDLGKTMPKVASS